MVDPELVVELQDLGLGQLREIVFGLRLGVLSGLDGRVEPLELVLVADEVGQVALLHHVQDLRKTPLLKISLGINPASSFILLNEFGKNENS